VTGLNLPEPNRKRWVGGGGGGEAAAAAAAEAIVDPSQMSITSISLYTYI